MFEKERLKVFKKTYSYFFEPQLDTGYPDLVIVEYYSLPKIRWEKERKSLNTTDLKILFYINNKKNTTIDDICSILGFSKQVINKSIIKLNNSRLIRVSRKKNIRNISLCRYFKVNKIISIEAKIDKWSEAIRQANNNIWFSTESYILMNKNSCSQGIIDICKKNGIGVILSNGNFKKVLSSNKRTLPVSYASLQFNEWLLRYINQ